MENSLIQILLPSQLQNACNTGTALKLEASTIYTATESKFGLNRRDANFPSWHA